MLGEGEGRGGVENKAAEAAAVTSKPQNPPSTPTPQTPTPQALQDPNPSVRDTTAWTLARVFEFLHGAEISPPLITQETLPPVIAVLNQSLQQDSWHVAYRVCNAISALAQGFQDYKGEGEGL